MMEWLIAAAHGLTELIAQLGYGGLFIMTLIDATIIPLPIEATLLPAGYLIHQGEMNAVIALIVSVCGTVCGSVVNYWLAQKYGRALLLRFGRFVFMNEEKLAKLERFFNNHGSISVFIGRLMPGLRHYIALPAGLAHMGMRPFLLYSTLGGIVTTSMLLACGYLIGASEEAAAHYMPYIKIGMAALAIIIIGLYIFRHRRKRAGEGQ